MNDFIEPEAWAVFAGTPQTADTAKMAINASIAISLKRIADAIVGDDQTTGIALTLHYIERRLGQQS